MYDVIDFQFEQISVLLNYSEIKDLNLAHHMTSQTKLKIYYRIRNDFLKNAEENDFEKIEILRQVKNQYPEFMLDRMVFSSLQQENIDYFRKNTYTKPKRRPEFEPEQHIEESLINNPSLSQLMTHFEQKQYQEEESEKQEQQSQELTSSNIFTAISQEKFLDFSEKDLEKYQVLYVEDQGKKEIHSLLNSRLKEYDGFNFRELDTNFLDKFCTPWKIVEGGLHNTYFLAALRAVAEKPVRVLNMFSEDKEGARLVWKGKWREVVIQKQIPIKRTERIEDIFLNGGGLVSLLEQAWAIIFGSYENIRYGFCEEALHAFTGAPITQIYLHDHDNLDKYWEYLKYSRKNQYIMIGLLTQEPWLMKYPIPLSKYAYTILNAFQLSLNGSKQRIVQLRTVPEDQKKGKWSYDATIWNDLDEEIRSLLCSEKNKKQGIFYLSYSELVQECKSILVAEISDTASFVYNSSAKDENNGALFRVQISKKGMYNFRIDKGRKPLNSVKEMRMYRPAQGVFEVAQRVGRRLVYYEGMMSRKKNMSKTYVLEQGVYLIYAIDSTPEEEITFGIYAQYPPKITPAQIRDRKLFFEGQFIEQEQENEIDHLSTTSNQQAIPELPQQYDSSQKQSSQFERDVQSRDQRSQQNLLQSQRSSKHTNDL